jgi:hypothetical protein
VNRERRGMTIPLVVVLLAAVMVVALAGRSQASMQRRAVEKVLSRRLAELAAASAFEEAAAAVERANAAVPPPPISLKDGAMVRDLGPSLTVPAAVEPALAGPMFRADGIALDAVRARTSAWVLIARPAPGGVRQMELAETGVLELAVTVTVHGPTGDARYQVTCRRTMDATPASGNASLRVRVHPQNRAVVVSPVS